MEARGPLVLVVDAEPDFLQSLEDVLKIYLPRLRLVAFTRAAAAFEFLEHASVDLVIADYRLPGQDGLTFLQRVAERWPGTSLVLVSAFGQGHLRRLIQGRDLDVRLWAKPFEVDRLVAQVQEALDHTAPAAIRPSRGPAAAP